MNPRVLYRAAAYGDARSIADSTITALSPTAWYHMMGAGVPTSSGGFASMWPDMADTDKGLVCPGSTSNGASAPDIAAYTVTDLDVRVRLSLNDWTPSSIKMIAAKDGAEGQRGWSLGVDTTGAFIIYSSNDGTAFALNGVISTAATGFTNGDVKWMRCVLDVDNGAGAYELKFYTAADSETEPSSWTQLGATVTGGATTTLFDNNGLLRCGGNFTDFNSPLDGIIKRCILKSGIDGTTVFDADFSAQAKGTTSFTESSSNGATVTVNQSGALPAHIGNKKDLLQGTGTNQPAYSAGVITFDGVDNYLKTNAFTLNQPETIYIVFKQITWASSDGIFDGNTSGSGMLQQNAITPNLGIQANNYCPDLITGMAVNTYGIVTVVFNGASSYISLNDGENATANAGTQNMGAFILGARGSALNPSNVAVKEAIIFSAAHDAATRTSVINALNTLNTVF